MPGAEQAAPVDGDLPALSVVELAETGEEEGVERGLAGVGVFPAAVVADDAVHERAPVDEAGAREHQGAHLGVLFLPVFQAHADGRAEPAVHDRKLPVIAVVNLAAADEDGRAGEHVADLEIVLVEEAAEVLLEGEHRLDRVGLGRGVIPVIVLGEGFRLELRGRPRRKGSEQEQHYEKPLHH